tara:strand:- start:1393 stop:3669 length:2277 start_codon:yes stop_codon:yes gene_type:complete
MSYCVYTNGTDMTNIEIKGSLARLLATENLVVEHKQVPTASFDVDKRVLTLPMWTRASDEVYNLLVGHEVGHALFTPNEDIFENLPCPKGYLNVTEDARIEKLIKRKFPGLSKDFHTGYSELNDEDFFCIEDENVELLPLIDRINLHFKIGSYALMPFSSAETPLRDAVGNAETFQEAIDAAKAIYEYAKAEEDRQDGNDNQGTEAISMPTPSKEQMDGMGGDPIDTDNPLEDLSTGKGNPAPPTFAPDVDTPESKYDEGGENTEKVSTGENRNQGYGRPSIEVVQTQRSFDYNATGLADYESGANLTYATFPKKVKYDNIIVKAETLWTAAEKEWNEFVSNPELLKGEPDPLIQVDQAYTDFVKSSSKDVSYMVKEFESKKAASAYARASVAKTGVLDTSKLHTYKFNDDIFKKVTRTPDGKNHGLIFLLDWSGSMSGEIYETILQVINLCQFCKKVGIPFDVYSFVVDGGMCLLQDGRDMFDVDPDYVEPQMEVTSRNSGEFFIDKRFRYGNLLTSKVNQKTFNLHCKYLYRIANYYKHRNNWNYTAPRPPRFMGLGGTPLNEALVVMKSYMGKWKAAHNVEKCHLIVLTDGESQCLPTCRTSDAMFGRVYPDYGNYTQTIIRDNGRHYKSVCPSNSEMTNRLLEVLRETYPESNILGIRICPSRGFSHFLRYQGIWDQGQIEKYQKVMKKKKCAVITNTGYDELYVVQSNSYSEDTEMKVESGATKAEIKRAFGKSLKSKATNRNMLSAFVCQIA